MIEPIRQVIATPFSTIQPVTINFITNVSLAERSGGWTGANAGLFESLSKVSAASYVGPISPGNDYLAKIPSKTARLMGKQGSFHFFSKRRLNRIASILTEKINTAADCNFFFGNTPWIHFSSSLPFFVYTDCSFHTYLETYQDGSQFTSHDVERIVDTEAGWLNRAEGVFVASSWAAAALRDSYHLSETKVKAVGVGGAIPIPLTDTYEGGADLVFIAYDFDSKGGLICFELLKRLVETIPEMRLVVIGGPPGPEVLSHPRVRYLGILQKTDAKQLAQYQAVLEKAFLVVHPSTVDMGSAGILEAAFYGCPSVAPRRSGYLEQVQDGVTGLLVDLPVSVERFSESILKLFENTVRYRTMRASARKHALSNFTWDGIALTIMREISARLVRLIDGPIS